MLLLAGAGLLVFGVAWRGTARTAPAAPAALGGTRSAPTQSATMQFGGLTRTYLLHVPSGYAATAPLPVVFVLHGATQSAASAERMSGMSAKADQNHFIAVYPSGTGRLPTWNSGNCCAYATRNRVDDVGFLRALLAKLEGEYPVDRKRIYFTGISNGAMMSYRMACEMAGQVAAIAPVEGALNVDCHPSEPVSVLIFHGTADRIVPFDGGASGFPRRTDNSVANAVNFWVKRDACAGSPEHNATSEVHIDRYSRCRQGTAVALYAIQGGHHMWPGLAISGNSIPATDLIWSFFAAHPKP